jgi:hypothetical protein
MYPNGMTKYLSKVLILKCNKKHIDIKKNNRYLNHYKPMNKTFIAFTFIFFAFSFVGCANSSETFMTTHRYEPIPLTDVVVFVSEADLPKEYEKVALIETTFLSDGEKFMWKSVTQKAAKLGANGVYMLSKKETPKGVQLATALLVGVPTSDKAQFVAIRFQKQE